MTDPDDSGRHLTSEPGQWLSILHAAGRLRITDRSVRRMVAEGRLLRRLRQGKAEVWVPESMPAVEGTDEPLDCSQGTSSDVHLTTADDTDITLAVLAQQRAMIERLNELAAQQMAPLLEKLDDRDAKIGELERKNGRLQAELDAERERQVTSVDTINRPWWRRWFAP